MFPLNFTLCPYTRSLFRSRRVMRSEDTKSVRCYQVQQPSNGEREKGGGCNSLQVTEVAFLMGLKYIAPGRML